MSNELAKPTDLRSLLTSEQQKKQFALALPSILPVDRFLRCLITTMNRVPDLALCDKTSVMAGAMTAAQLGLEIDPALGRAYLLPFNDKTKGKVAQLIIGYKGFVELAYRSGQISGFQAEPVYEKDFFEYALGLNPKLEHVPFDGDRGNLKYAYAIATMKTGGSIFKVLNKSEVMKHKAHSRSANSSYSPWNTHEPEMWAKTAIRALSNLLPLSPEMREAVSAEEADYSGFPIDLGEAITVPELTEEQKKEREKIQGN